MPSLGLSSTPSTPEIRQLSGSQSVKLSILETITSTLIGFLVSYAAGLAVFPALGFNVTHTQNFTIVTIYTILSILRGYGVRRFFNALQLL